MLTRRSKVDPFTGCPLSEGWNAPESELDRRMSNAPVKCFFSHRGMNISTANNEHLNIMKSDCLSVCVLSSVKPH